MNNILPIGAILRDRYQIIEILSTKTGFGITYKVKDRNHPNQRILVIKQLKKPTPESLKIEKLPKAEQQEKINQVWANYLRLFRKETQALANLGEKYNQIPTIHERFTELGEEFYVQEYIEGHSLAAEIQPGKKLTEDQVKSLLMEILAVVEYIQDINNNKGYAVIHRDIKPENIIRRREDNKLVIIDFGLVKEVTFVGIKLASILGGTPGYIAPEMLFGFVSFASDIYSIGMIGVFAITGKDPSFTPNLAKNWQTKVNVSAEFADFLNKMICEDYKDRFQNAQEALTALKTNKPPIPTPQPTPPPTPSIPWKLIKLMMMGISGIMLIIGVVIGVIAILPKSDSQLIADGKGKSGQLTTTDNKELGSGKNIDVYRFKNLILTGCKEPEKVVFSCETDNNGEHTTKVKYQNQTRDLIVWKRTDFVKAGFPPQRRCAEVTPKLQDAYDNGTLPTLTWGYTEVQNNVNKRFKSLCTTTGKECHTLILTLLESDDADKELKKFTAVLNGDASSAYQNSSDCKPPQQTGANLTCTVDIFKVFNK